MITFLAPLGAQHLLKFISLLRSGISLFDNGNYKHLAPTAPVDSAVRRRNSKQKTALAALLFTIYDSLFANCK